MTSGVTAAASFSACVPSAAVVTCVAAGGQVQRQRPLHFRVVFDDQHAWHP